MNDFIKVNTMGEGTAMTENGAVSYATIGSALLDQFGKAASYRGRDINTVWNEQEILWAENPEFALKFPFYLRMITRQSNITGKGKTEKVQRGAGVRDEAFKRLLWIAKYHPTEFYHNLWLLPVVGSWKDLWVLLSTNENFLDKKTFFYVIAEGINDASHKDLIKKYMPRIRSNKKCNTEWAKNTNNLAKEFCKYVGWSYNQYRFYKSTGKAHEFQTIICKGLYNNINWNTIPGKALLNLVSGKFLQNHNLEEKYINWINEQPVAKFNGYPFELGRKIGTNRYVISLAEKITIDKQFDCLIKTGKSDNGAINGNVLCALDTSCSMACGALDKNGTTPFHVCVSLGIYFSELNTGDFHNVVAMFDNKSSLLKLKGNTFSEKWNEITSQNTAWGGTNYMSLIDMIVDTRKNNPNMDINDFPTTLLVVSDMQFNNCGYRSNYEITKQKLSKVFPKEFVDNFKIVWWYCTNRKTSDFPSTMEHGGTYMFSGYDGSIISFLLGGENNEKESKTPPTMQEIIEAAFNQEVLSLIK